MERTRNAFYCVHVIAAVIFLACLLMNGPMRGGLPVDNTLAERIAFIAANGTIWSLSWCIWMLSALGLFVFCTILSSQLVRCRLRTLGLSFVGMGIVPDLIAEVLYAFVIPDLIRHSASYEIIAVLETTAMHLTGFLGNGLYNLGGVTLTWLTIQQGLIRSWVAVWGMLSWGLGLMLSASIGMQAMGMAEIFTASSMLLSTLWMLIFAHKVLKP